MATADSGYAVTSDSRLVKTSDRGKNWTEVRTVGNGSEAGDGGALFALDEKTVFIAFRTSTGIEFGRSSDAGANWSKSSIKTNVDDANAGYGGNLFLNFVDGTNGFLLSSSAAGLGQMSKALYRTTDGGNSWLMVDQWDLGGSSSGPAQGKQNARIQGYTTGMAFCTPSKGLITCSYHGQSEISVYQTADGGKSWSVAPIPLPEKFASYPYGDCYYVDAYAPSFSGSGRQSAKMMLCFVDNSGRDSQRDPYIFSSDNGGAAWKISGESDLLIRKYCFIDDQNGFGLDEYGTLYATENGGSTWIKI